MVTVKEIHDVLKDITDPSLYQKILSGNIVEGDIIAIKASIENNEKYDQEIADAVEEYLRGVMNGDIDPTEGIEGEDGEGEDGEEDEEPEDDEELDEPREVTPFAPDPVYYPDEETRIRLGDEESGVEIAGVYEIREAGGGYTSDYVSEATGGAPLEPAGDGYGGGEGGEGTDGNRLPIPGGDDPSNPGSGGNRYLTIIPESESDHPRGTLTNNDGEPILISNGAQVRLYSSANQIHVDSDTGTVVGPTGQPIRGEDGEPIVIESGNYSIIGGFADTTDPEPDPGEGENGEGEDPDGEEPDGEMGAQTIGETQLLRHGNPSATEPSFSEPEAETDGGEVEHLSIYEAYDRAEFTRREPKTDGGTDTEGEDPDDTNALPGSDTGSAQEYKTLKLGAGERKTIRVGAGETFSNMLIDMTATNAEAQIIASGSGWTIRNVGFKGSADRSGPHSPGKNIGGFANLMSATGTGLIEHVYFGDGVASDDVRKGAIGVSRSHSGKITLREVHMNRWTGNAIYQSGAADGGKGTVHFDRCLATNNNISSLRAAGNSTIKNCVLYNTKQVPRHPLCKCVNSRAVYTGYGVPSQTLTVENCHIDHTSANTNGAASALVSSNSDTTIVARNNEIKGSLIGNVKASGNGSDPDLTPPEGVPMSAEAGASGQGGKGGGTPETPGEDGEDGEGGESQAPVPVEGTLQVPLDLPEPPRTLEIKALIGAQKYEELVPMRERETPFTIYVGEFSIGQVGITELSREINANQPGLVDCTISIQEHRYVQVQQEAPPSTGGDSSGGGGTGDGSSPTGGWVDENNDGIDDITGEKIPEFSRVKVPSGKRHTVVVGNGQTFGNTLIDISAGGAMVMLRPTGNGWNVQNVGIKGRSKGGHYLVIPGVPSAGAKGQFNKLYMGDGQVPRTDPGGIWVNANLPHRGTIDFNQINVQRYVDNGLYGSGPGVWGHPGSCNVYNSYFNSNNISNIRLSGKGRKCFVKNVTVNGGSPPPCGSHGCSKAGAVSVRGIWAWYGPVSVADSDIKAPMITNKGGSFQTSNVRTGGSANGQRVPEGCPRSAEDAAGRR